MAWDSNSNLMTEDFVEVGIKAEYQNGILRKDGKGNGHPGCRQPCVVWITEPHTLSPKLLLPWYLSQQQKVECRLSKLRPRFLPGYPLRDPLEEKSWRNSKTWPLHIWVKLGEELLMLILKSLPVWETVLRATGKSATIAVWWQQHFRCLLALSQHT